MNTLERIYQDCRAAIVEQKRRQTLSDVRASALDQAPTRGFARALKSSDGISVIAEIKFKSPSEGVLRDRGTVPVIAREYVLAGAAALSILTEPSHFGGSLENLRLARDAVSVPLLRKDFIFDEYQIYQSRSAGADAILLISAMLEPNQLTELAGCAHELEVDILVEVHDQADLTRCQSETNVIWGVNHRNLKTLAVDLSVSDELVKLLPPDSTKVAESGITRAADLRLMQTRGFDAVLIGSHLMKAESPGQALSMLLHDGTA